MTVTRWIHGVRPGLNKTKAMALLPITKAKTRAILCKAHAFFFISRADGIEVVSRIVRVCWLCSRKTMLAETNAKTRKLPIQRQ